MESLNTQSDSYKESVNRQHRTSQPGLEALSTGASNQQINQEPNHDPNSLHPAQEATILGVRLPTFFLSVALAIAIIVAAIGGGIGGLSYISVLSGNIALTMSISTEHASAIIATN
ncbi:hypothetical protein GGS21DRAFT_492617 [Xylaria nigripes]|nr:hypothetical protein GGS21DRAFT_492617 [Xylaria nigripes]